MRLNSANAVSVLWVLAGTFLFSVVFASAKVFDTEIAPLALVFVRYAVGTAIMIGLRGLLRFPLAPATPRSLGMHGLRAGLGGLGATAAIYAAANAPVAQAASIGLLDGAIAVLLGIVFLRERVTVLRAVGLGIAAVGAAHLVTERGGWTGGVDRYALVAFLGAVLVALEGLLIRVLSQKESAHSVLFYVNAMGAGIFAVPGMLLLGSSDLISILTICLLGPIAILGQYCFTFGYRGADLAIVAPAGYSWIVFAASIGIVLGEPFPPAMLPATCLIVASGLLLVLDRAQQSRLVQETQASSAEPFQGERV